MPINTSELKCLLQSHYPEAVWEHSRWQSLSGGSIHQSFRVENDVGIFFVKANKAEALENFQAEASNLQALAAAQAKSTSASKAQIPTPLAVGGNRQVAFLLLPFLDLHERSNAAMGEALAGLHRVSGDYFGWPQDNFIGSSRQKNGRYREWPRFWQEQRLAAQRQQVISAGYKERFLDALEKLIADCPIFFQSYQPLPSLLHGDLWSGNAAVTPDGQPVFFDPACYYGDREADLAMTELFGGFSADFYAAYRHSWPLDQGFGVRKTLYNLYHLLNHLFLFGNGYRQAVEQAIYKLLSEL
jgi:fructosamine-3-kinase